MTAACKRMEIFAGPADCLERDCEEYVDDNGNDIASVVRCSHVTVEEACETHTTPGPDQVYEFYDHVEPWPCQHAAVSA